MGHLVFVYGTLRKGWHNHRHYLDCTGAKFIGEGRTLGKHRMVAAGVPFVAKHGGEHTILGELYEVNDEVLENLDRLEGHPSFYCREKELVRVNGFVTSAWIYFNERGMSKSMPVISDGDYANFERDWW
jgi:gamma-glutamylaminecyclotransferase